MLDVQRIFVGFDGFVDTICHCVEKRINPEEYSRMPTIESFMSRIQNAESKSMNIECVVQEKTCGGNAPLLAQSLASLGENVDLVGCCGFPSINQVFSPLEKMGISLYSFAEPGLTDALEFKDGKVLLGKMGELGKIHFQEAMKRLPSGLLFQLLNESACIAMVNWTMMPLVGEAWNWLFTNKNFFSHQAQKKWFFTDLADPKKRPLEDLRKSLLDLKALNEICYVILGLNEAESEQIAHLFEIPYKGRSLQDIASDLLKALDISVVVVHTHKEVAASSCVLDKEESVFLSVPQCRSLKRSTGAGDAFNAGFLSSILNKNSLLQALKSAIATSGIWVRRGHPATKQDVSIFLDAWQSGLDLDTMF